MAGLWNFLVALNGCALFFVSPGPVQRHSVCVHIALFRYRLLKTSLANNSVDLGYLFCVRSALSLCKYSTTSPSHVSYFLTLPRYTRLEDSRIGEMSP